MNMNKEKTGEILIRNRYITASMLAEALEYQDRYGGLITEYLINHGYLKEDDLVRCITEQFKIPYLPVGVCEISNDVIQMVPADIVKKYQLVPIDNIKSILTVVMVDPLDEKAIKEIEDITGCQVRQFVGLFSEIKKAAEHYYNVILPTADDKILPAVEYGKQVGHDRRKAIRLKSEIEVYLSRHGLYQRSRTQNVSAGGLLVELDNNFSRDSYVTIEFDLPEKAYPYPIAAVGRVVWLTTQKSNTSIAGLEFIKIDKQDLVRIIKYAHLQSLHMPASHNSLSKNYRAA